MTDAAFEIELPPSEKMVLLSLAHCHNGKTGRCNPAVSRIAYLAGLSVRNVSYTLNKLRDRGLIEYEPSSGRRSNNYKLNFKPCNRCRVNHDSNPANSATNPANSALNPARVAYKQGRTRKEHGNKTIGENKSRSRNETNVNTDHLEETMIDPRLLPAFIDQDIWQDFRDNRRRCGARMTDVAEKYLLRKLQKLHAAGHDVNECMCESICNGWKGVFEPKQTNSGVKKSGLVEHLKREGAALFGDLCNEPGGHQAGGLTIIPGYRRD